MSGVSILVLMFVGIVRWCGKRLQAFCRSNLVINVADRLVRKKLKKVIDIKGNSVIIGRGGINGADQRLEMTQ